MQAFFLYSGLAGLCNLLRDKKIAVTAFIYISISSFILFKYGINANGEAAKYIEDAQNIISGKPLDNGFFGVFYVLYSLLVSFFLKLSLNFQGIAVIQILFSLIAACCIYKIIYNETAHQNISYITFAIYLLCLPIQKWIFFLYTESLHTSFIVIGLYFLYCVIQKRQTAKWFILLLFSLLILFSRPVGIIFLITTCFIFFIWLIKRQRKVLYFSFIGTFIILLIVLFQSKFTFYFNPDSLRRMEVICQVPQTNASISYKEFNSEGLASFFNVITNDIGVKNFIILGLKKLYSFFGMGREFYSTAHNIILLFTAAILYPLAFIGLFFSRNKTSYIKIFCGGYIILTAIGIFFTCDEWSNRFIAPVLPFIIILAGRGLYSTSLSLKNKIN